MNGKVIFTLEEYLQEHNISKNYMVYHAQVQRTQLQNYCKNKVARIDLNVLARICSVLDCEIGDIMKFEKEE
jgi:putative transcriptional regulator